ncbi:transposase [Streptomyces zaomyceticus]|uniref:transposase n=1 Tax=Streptomyces zaomyceticus TaxID=68286 RepID=UPI0036AFDDC1
MTDTAGLIEVLEQMKVFYRRERVMLVWDELSTHWSRAMRAWVAEQDWLSHERLPADAPGLNPVELLWFSLKKRELVNLAGDHLANVADATEQGIHHINDNPQLPWFFLTHTGLTLHPPTPQNQRKISRTNNTLICLHHLLRSLGAIGSVYGRQSREEAGGPGSAVCGGVP